MKIITAEQVHAALRFPDFIDDLREAFRRAIHHAAAAGDALDEASGSHDAFAMLPSWNDEVIALKAFTYFPENQPPRRTLYSQIWCLTGSRGEPLGAGGRHERDLLADGGGFGAGVAFPFPRGLGNAAAVGTGKLAPFLIRAHASVRPLKQSDHLGPLAAKADSSWTHARRASRLGISSVARIRGGLRARQTSWSRHRFQEILVHGEWIRPGTHTDFLGNHHATKRECDTEMVTDPGSSWIPGSIVSRRRAKSSSRSGGVFRRIKWRASFGTLPRQRAGRQNDQEITLFKSVGCALADLCGALATYRSVG